MQEELTEYRQADAARFLHRTPQRVLQWRQRGDLVGYYHGRVWLVSRAELEAFAARPQRGPGAPKGPRKKVG